ncbi:hypothetical protein Cni_G26875 [Canna indica]|uniref:Uncharacterized protein n=1 Tax=Canna indica TaxID=4628 RepID=A0AAQ3L2X7_9LILI|nr:hypothetical protein Cni_G26875 [Canna indica]
MEGSAIPYLVERIREEIFSPSSDMYSFLPPSAYETAWVAMIPSPHHPNRPMFPKCLQWILFNQREEGFWGDSAHDIQSLSATLACLAALKTWNTGHANVEQGLRFLNANMERILVQQGGRIPRWFTVVFPGMIELAQAKGLEVLPADGAGTEIVDDIFNTRNTIVELIQAGKHLQYLETLPASHRPKLAQILGHQMEDGSLFQSPSATACAFMVTGHAGFKDYLDNMLRRCGNIVPHTFPVDQDLIKLCLVDHLSRLGCLEHFAEETRATMDQVYSDWVIQELQAYRICDTPMQLQKDSLTFQLLRRHGYDVSPRKFCWFMDNKELLGHIEENYTEFLVAMHSIYRAANFMFPNEVELHDAKLFAKKVLQKSLPGSEMNSEPAIMTDIQYEIQDELGLPWLARMDHLEQRMYTEKSKGYSLSVGKASSFRLLSSKYATQLAVEVFRNRQQFYRSELEELKRWSNDSGLSSMGFGREKTTYCYFLTAAAVNLPLQSGDLRKIASKCAILVTVIDDFFDEEASLDELESLTEAVKRWKGEGLSGHSEVIFDGLDNLVRDISEIVFAQHGHDVKSLLQDMWRETFDAWLKEASWSNKRHAPSLTDYLEVAKISIAIQVMTLPACCLVIPEFPKDSPNSHYPKITELTMIASRLLNDTHSYQKEIESGKFNMVPLYSKENQGACAEDSIEHIRNIIEMKEKEFMEIYMNVDSYAGVPNEWKELHLATLKSFRMLFDTSNVFDSPTALLKSISSAFYDPIEIEAEKMIPVPSEKENSYKPFLKEMLTTLLRKNNGGLLRTTSDDGFAGKDCNAQRQKPQSTNITQSLKYNIQRSSKAWKMSKIQSSSGALVAPCFSNSTLWAKTSSFIL